MNIIGARTGSYHQCIGEWDLRLGEGIACLVSRKGLVGGHEDGVGSGGVRERSSEAGLGYRVHKGRVPCGRV